MEFKLRNRSRLRRKEIAGLARQLSDRLGTTTMFAESDPVEEAEAGAERFLILGNEILGLRHEGRPFLTLKGILKYGAKQAFVTVDMGAVRFVTNGADVMGPGITDADPAIQTGDLVWIREERHGKPLAIGIALSDAATLRAKAKGKQVRTLYVVGDRVWKWGEAEEEVEEEEDEETAPEAEDDEAESEESGEDED